MAVVEAVLVKLVLVPVTLAADSVTEVVRVMVGAAQVVVEVVAEAVEVAARVVVSGVVLAVVPRYWW